jgi:hypothetical protein
MGEYRKPPIGRRIQKGQILNPLGGATHNKEARAIRKLTTEDLETVISLIQFGKLDDLKAISQDKDANVLKIWIASIAVKAISKGDHAALNALLDRVIGKVKDRDAKGNITAEGNVLSPVQIYVPKNGSEDLS